MIHYSIVRYDKFQEEIQWKIIKKCMKTSQMR